MKSQITNTISKKVNPFFGFGWNTSIYSSRNESVLNLIKKDSKNPNKKMIGLK